MSEKDEKKDGKKAEEGKKQRFLSLETLTDRVEALEGAVDRLSDMLHEQIERIDQCSIQR